MRWRRPASESAPLATHGRRAGPPTLTRPSATSSHASGSSAKPIPCSQIQRSACSRAPVVTDHAAPAREARSRRAGRSSRTPSKLAAGAGLVELRARQRRAVEPLAREVAQFGLARAEAQRPARRAAATLGARGRQDRSFAGGAGRVFARVCEGRAGAGFGRARVRVRGLGAEVADRDPAAAGTLSASLVSLCMNGRPACASKIVHHTDPRAGCPGRLCTVWRIHAPSRLVGRDGAQVEGLVHPRPRRCVREDRARRHRSTIANRSRILGGCPP